MQESDFETAFVEGIADSGKEIDLFFDYKRIFCVSKSL